MAWQDNATIFYDWVRYGEPLTAQYAADVVQKTLDCHCDTLAFCVGVGGYALWPSAVSPKAPTLGDLDLIGEMTRLCRDNNLRFVPWWLGTAVGQERVLRQHPSWQIVGPPGSDAADSKLVMTDGWDAPTREVAASQKKHNYICYTSPYRQLLYDEIREVLANYEVDGIYFDQLPGSCYCTWCQAKFKQRYGQAMPIVANEFFVYNSAAGLPPLLREFRDDAVRSFCAGVRQIIDEVRPGTVYAQNWVRNQQAYLGVGTVDVMLPEFYQREDLIPLGLKHRLTCSYFDHGSMWGNVRHSVRHDARHHPLPGTRMLLVDCVANHAAPLMLDLCAMDFDPTGAAELAETFDHIRTMQETLADATEVPYAALLHSRRSHELYSGRFDEAFEGFYRTLVEAHVPFEIVTEADLAAGRLADYTVLVIPDAVSLAGASVDAIAAAVDSGMGLVATHMTGMVDESGSQRPQPALADLLGITMDDLTAYEARPAQVIDPLLDLPDFESEPFLYYGSARTDHPLAEGIAGHTRFSFHGSYVVFTPAADCQVLGHIHTTDQPRLSSRPLNRPGIYPAEARWPLAVTRQVGSARVAYFAPQADAQWRRLDAPALETLMLRAVLWAGGEPPVETPDCPASVEVRLLHNPQQRLYQLLLVNLTSNPLTRTPGGWGVVRYITPHKQLRLALRVDEAITSATGLLAGDLPCTTQDGRLIVDLPVLDLYESILLKY